MLDPSRLRVSGPLEAFAARGSRPSSRVWATGPRQKRWLPGHKHMAR